MTDCFACCYLFRGLYRLLPPLKRWVQSRICPDPFDWQPIGSWTVSGSRSCLWGQAYLLRSLIAFYFRRSDALLQALPRFFDCFSATNLLPWNLKNFRWFAELRLWIGAETCRWRAWSLWSCPCSFASRCRTSRLALVRNLACYRSPKWTHRNLTSNCSKTDSFTSPDRWHVAHPACSALLLVCPVNLVPESTRSRPQCRLWRRSLRLADGPARTVAGACATAATSLLERAVPWCCVDRHVDLSCLSGGARCPCWDPFSIAFWPRSEHAAFENFDIALGWWSPEEQTDRFSKYRPNRGNGFDFSVSLHQN